MYNIKQTSNYKLEMTVAPSKAIEKAHNLTFEIHFDKHCKAIATMDCTYIVMSSFDM